MKNIKLWFVTGLVLLVMGLAGCNSSGSQKANTESPEAKDTTITMWLMGSESEERKEFLTSNIEQFETENPGIQVEYQYIPWGEAHNQLVTSVVGGSTPDIAEMGSTWNPEFSAMGALAKTDEAVKEMGITQDLVPALKDAGSYEGSLYGVPWYAGVSQILYNKKLFEKAGVKAPKTYEELVNNGKIIKEKTGKYVYPAVGNNTNAFLPLVWAFGGDIAVKENGQWVSKMNEPEAVKAFKSYAKIYKQGLIPEGAVNWSSLEANQAFAQGDLAMNINQPFAVQDAISKNPDMKENIGIAPLPNKNIPFVGGSNLVVFEQSNKKKAAFKFIEFLTKEEQLLEFGKTTNFFPGRVSALQNSYYQNDPVLSKFTEAMKNGRTFPSSPSWGQIQGEGLIGKTVQKIMLGKQDVQPALDELTQNMNDIFQKQ